MATDQSGTTSDPLSEILKVYFTSPEELPSLLRSIEKETIITTFAQLINQYANDKNSSTLREQCTLATCGYTPLEGKLGYDGYKGASPNDGVCEVKPMNIRGESQRKLNGGGNFTDFTYQRLEKYIEDRLTMLVSGFVDGHLVYILEFPFSDLERALRRQLDRFFRGESRPGLYLRSASFSFVHYLESYNLKRIYTTPNLADFGQYLTKKLFDFLQEEL